MRADKAIRSARNRSSCPSTGYYRAVDSEGGLSSPGSYGPEDGSWTKTSTTCPVPAGIPTELTHHKRLRDISDASVIFFFHIGMSHGGRNVKVKGQLAKKRGLSPM